MPSSFGEPWLALWRFTTAMTWGSFASLAHVYDARAMRTAWSSQMTKSFDSYLRSPEFLELMASGLKATANVTRLTSQFRFR